MYSYAGQHCRHDHGTQVHSSIGCASTNKLRLRNIATATKHCLVSEQVFNLVWRIHLKMVPGPTCKYHLSSCCTVLQGLTVHAQPQASVVTRPGGTSAAAAATAANGTATGELAGFFLDSVYTTACAYRHPFVHHVAFSFGTQWLVSTGGTHVHALAADWLLLCAAIIH